MFSAGGRGQLGTRLEISGENPGQGFFQLFAQGRGGGGGGGKMRLYGASTYPCAKHVVN